MNEIYKQPILILGGFLINYKDYMPMANYLKKRINQPVEIVKTTKLDWLCTNWEFGWKRILNKVDIESTKLLEQSATGKITIIGHSSGGVMLRLFLSNKPEFGVIYNGKNKANILITLGSPHNAIRSTVLRKMVNNKYPGSYFKKDVSYVSIAGNLSIDSKDIKKITKRIASSSYLSINGNKDSKGDGLVPLESAMLEGSKKIVINDSAHSKLFGENWYCNIEITKIWWEKLNNLT